MQSFSRKRRVLCVDDEEKNLAFLAKILSSEGYDVVPTTNPVIALDLILQQKIDIILLDVMMSPISGYDVCRAIKDSPLSRNIPVIMLTGLASVDERIRGIEAGAEDFITKPFDVVAVIARIRMLLKVKELNDQLNSAYNNITNLIYIGKRLIWQYNQFDFDFYTNLETIITESILSKTVEDTEKPKLVLIGVREKSGKWVWTRYRYFPDGSKKDTVEFNFCHSAKLLEDRNSYVSFFNNGGSGKEVSSTDSLMHDDLKTIEPGLKNAAYSVGEEVAMFCLNYGKIVTHYDADTLESFTMQILYLNSLSGQIRQTESAFTYTVFALARAAEATDTDTGEHIIRVGHYCARIARCIGLPEKLIKTIRTQAALHDVGKTHVPISILRKHGLLSLEEWEEIKKHTVYGAKIIGDHPMLGVGKNIALFHHERWDGYGYPQGLKGEEIPIESRIMNIADQYDALRSIRPYKSAYEHDVAYKIITEGDGRTMPAHFDPNVLSAFKAVNLELKELFDKPSRLENVAVK